MSASTLQRYRILVVDDEQSILNLYQSILAPEACDLDRELIESGIMTSVGVSTLQEQYLEDHASIQCDLAIQGNEAIEMVHNADAASLPYAVAFIDIRMPPGIDGVSTATRIREIDPNIQLFIVTAYSDYSIEEIESQIPYQVVFLRKPFYAEDLLLFTQKALQAWDRRQELEQLKQRLSQTLPIEHSLSWNLNLATGSFLPSIAFETALHKQKIDNISHYEQWIGLFHPDDTIYFRKQLDSGEPLFTLLHRLKGGRGDYLWVLSECRIDLWQNDTPLELSGYTTFISKQRRNQLNAISNSFSHLDLQQLKRPNIVSGIEDHQALRKRCAHLLRVHQVFTLIEIKINPLDRLIQSSGKSAGDMLLHECVKKLTPKLPANHETYQSDSRSLVVILNIRTTPQTIAGLLDRLQQILRFKFSPRMINLSITAQCHAYHSQTESDQIEKLVRP